MTKYKGLNTICTHVGEIKDTQFGGAVSPIFMASSYPYLDLEVKRYPRYFNTPNQESVAHKIAALEHAESALPFASGMAAISSTLLAFLKLGDHVVFQNEIYGGAYNFVVEEFDKFGIEYSFTKGVALADFEREIKKNTKVIYIETPSNPLLTLTDIAAVAKLAKRKGLISMADNTFASPVNQMPIDFGFDIVLHSATKYLGGHSDICAGAVASTKENINTIFQKSKNLGGNMSDFMCYLLERSIKTLGLRVKQHNENAMAMAHYLENHRAVKKVYYPGLESHPNHQLAKVQMKGFGGMLSFELNDDLDAVAFQKALRMVKPSLSLAGVESTILLPALTSHALMGAKARKEQGISDNLLRFSIGIEEIEDIIADVEQAISKIIKK